jgi:DNA-dependent RNA polymerase auxiliary subunit epsilon
MIKTEKIDIEKVIEIVADIKSKPNKELTQVMDFLAQDFEETKKLIVELTYHIDNIENLYNKVLKEYQTRNG